MPSNSIAPSRKVLDLYKDGADWKVALFADDGTTQIADTTIGTVDVGVAGVVSFATPLDLRAIGGDAANKLRLHGAGDITIRPTEVFNADFPFAKLTTVDGEVISQQVELIKAIGGSITRVRIAWG